MANIDHNLAARLTFHLTSLGNKGCKTTPTHPFHGIYTSSLCNPTPFKIIYAHCFGSSRFYATCVPSPFIKLFSLIGVSKLVG